MSNETTTVNGDEIDPETGEVLQQHNVRPEQPITNPEELTAFLTRLAYHGVSNEAVSDGGWAMEQVIIDTVTGERVDAFVHCTPGVKNGKVKYTRPTTTEGGE